MNAFQYYNPFKKKIKLRVTSECYSAFWSLIGKHLVDCISYSCEFGELSNSQKQAIITLTEKKGKDKRLIKNWRPISLINIDAKIISKVSGKSFRKGTSGRR